MIASRWITRWLRVSLLLVSACGAGEHGNPGEVLTNLSGGTATGAGGMMFPVNGTGATTTNAGMLSTGGAVLNSGGNVTTPSTGGDNTVMMTTGGVSPATGGTQDMMNTGSTTAPPPTDCGTRTGMRGKTSRSLMVGGTARTYIAYLPESASPTTPLPFVYVFHGANQTGQYLYDATEYSTLADSEGIAVVFPDGQGTSSATSTGSLAPWKVTDGPLLCGAGTLVSAGGTSDLDFVDAIRDDIKQDQCLDEDHVFATGFSMGGYFSHHIACVRPDFRAAAPHSGGTMADLSTCTTDHMPIIIFHGTSDPLIADNCDDPEAAADPTYPASATLWAMKNGCQPTYTTVPTNGAGGGAGSCYVYDGCPEGAQVEMCAFQGMSHCWAGATSCQSCIGTGPEFASATQLEWDFFKQYAW